MEVIVLLNVEASRPEIQELHVFADYVREVQSIIVKAFAHDVSASEPNSEVAEVQRVIIEVSRYDE